MRGRISFDLLGKDAGAASRWLELEDLSYQLHVDWLRLNALQSICSYVVIYGFIATEITLIYVRLPTDWQY